MGVADADCLSKVSCEEDLVRELLAGSSVSFCCSESCVEGGRGKSEMAFLPSTKTLILRCSRSGPIFGRMNKCGISSMSLHSIISCQRSCRICFPGGHFYITYTKVTIIDFIENMLYCPF